MVDTTSGEFRRLSLDADAVRLRPQGLAWQVRKRLRADPLKIAAAAFGLMAALLLAALLASHGPDRNTGAEAPRVAMPPPVWAAIARPQPAFIVELPGERPGIEARRHAEGGGREDIFTAGAPGAAGGFVRVVAYRPGSEATPSPSFFLALARRAAEAGFAVGRSVVPAPVSTRLGLADTAEVQLVDASGPHACLAWRWEAEDDDLRLSGWSCAGAERPVDRAGVACIIDRMELAPGTGDRALRALFQTTGNPRSSACPARSPVTQRRSA